jgi:hypothetical protein
MLDCSSDDRDESAKLARLSYEMSVRLEALNRGQSPKLSTKEVFVVAVKFCLLVRGTFLLLADHPCH